ncbi:MAG: hypothetical protein ACHQ51_00270 [Elusimicrobiota bacterium]
MNRPGLLLICAAAALAAPAHADNDKKFGETCAGVITQAQGVKSKGYPLTGTYLLDVGRECSQLRVMSRQLEYGSAPLCQKEKTVGSEACFKTLLQAHPPRSSTAVALLLPMASAASLRDRQAALKKDGKAVPFDHMASMADSQLAVMEAIDQSKFFPASYAPTTDKTRDELVTIKTKQASTLELERNGILSSLSKLMVQLEPKVPDCGGVPCAAKEQARHAEVFNALLKRVTALHDARFESR